MSNLSRMDTRRRVSDDSGAITAVTVVLALLIGILSAAGAGLYAASASPRYTSHAVVLIDDPLGIAISRNSGVIDKLIRLRQKYAALIITQDFIARVATRSGEPFSRVQSALSSDISAQSQTMTILAEASRAYDAKTIAAAASNELADFAATEQRNANIPVNQRFEIRVVTPGNFALKTAPTSDRTLRVSLFAAAFAVLLVLAAAQLPIRRKR